MHTVIKQQGSLAVDITVQRGQCDVGDLWLATTSLGICQLELVIDNHTQTAGHALASRWPGCTIHYSEEPINVAALFRDPQTFHLAGTAFQQRVWAELLTIPKGETRTYGEIAKAIGRPQAFRAVGSAIGKNPVAILIPCHRVLAADRQIGGFYWGPEIKRQLLAAEGVFV